MSASTSAAPARVSSPSTGLLVVLLVGAQFMVSMDATIVNVALPSIRGDLHLLPADLSWVVNAYALTFGGLLLLGSKLGDRFGRRRMFVVGTAVFSASSLAGGLATTAGELVAARAVQGVGAALMSPVAMALILASFTGHRRHQALGLWGAMSGLAGGLGMLAGGALSTVSWRWNFFVNLPIGALILLGAFLVLDETRIPTTGPPDAVGAVLCTVGLSSLVYGVVGIERFGIASPITAGALAAGALLLAMFAVVEARAADPVVPLRIFRLRSVSAGNGVTALTGAVGQVTYFILTLYLQQVRHLSPLQSGAAFIPISVAIYVTSTRTAALIRIVGTRSALLAGAVVSVVGLIWLSFVPATGGSYAAAVLGPSVLWGLGWGLAQAASFIAPAEDVGTRWSGVASGLISTTYRIGGAIGLASMVALASAHTASVHGSAATALTAGYSLALRGAAVFACAGAVITLLLPASRGVPSDTN